MCILLYNRKILPRKNLSGRDFLPNVAERDGQSSKKFGTKEHKGVYQSTLTNKINPESE